MKPSDTPTPVPASPAPNRLPGGRDAQSQPNGSVWRILDASGNRAAEGLRVVEDHLRFSLNDGHLAGWAKRLRHSLAGGLAKLPTGDLVAARDSAGDPGRSVKTEQESSRPTAESVVRANLKRIQQALRSLEEWGKFASSVAHLPFEQLRYETYELESAIERAWQVTRILADGALYVLVDGAGTASDFGTRVAVLLEEEVDIIQLRDKRLSDRELLGRGRQLLELASGTTTQVIVNDRPDLAKAVGAAGVHLGQDDLTIAAARTLLGPHALVGVSTHSLAQAHQGVLNGASYIGVGPTFPSRTKSFGRFPGPELLRAVVSEISLPTFAIGGINLQNVDQVLACGISRVAVGAAIWAADAPAESCRQFRRHLTSERAARSAET